MAVSLRLSCARFMIDTFTGLTIDTFIHKIFFSHTQPFNKCPTKSILYHNPSVLVQTLLTSMITYDDDEKPLKIQDFIMNFEC